MCIHNINFCGEIRKLPILTLGKIKALRALVDRLSLSVGLENGPERGLKTVLFNP